MEEYQHHPRHHNGWHFDNGPRSYIHEEPYMTVNEYQSYRMMWIAVFGGRADLKRYEPPEAKPKQVRDV